MKIMRPEGVKSRHASTTIESASRHQQGNKGNIMRTIYENDFTRWVPILHENLNDTSFS